MIDTELYERVFPLQCYTVTERQVTKVRESSNRSCFVLFSQNEDSLVSVQTGD